MTENELKHLEELCAKATPGPWLRDGSGYVFVKNIEIGNSSDNAEFIIAAREALPKLIAEVRRLQARLNEILKECPVCAVEHTPNCITGR